MTELLSIKDLAAAVMATGVERSKAKAAQAPSWQSKRGTAEIASHESIAELCGATT
jgi:hypothetical protein